MTDQSALSTLVYQGVLTAAKARVYSPSNPVSLTRLALANVKDTAQTVTLYHRLAVDKDAVDNDSNPILPGATQIVAVYDVAATDTQIDPAQSIAAITLQGDDELWAEAETSAAVTLSLYVLPRSMAPISTPYGIL